MDPFDDDRVIVGTDNVFADLGLEDAVELALRGDLARVVRKAIAERRLSRRDAAQVLGIDRSEVEHLLQSHLERFSSGELLEFLIMLGYDAVLTIRPAGSGQTSHRVAVGDLALESSASDHEGMIDSDDRST